MKVFDYSDGRKGEQLGDIKRANSMAGCLVTKDGTTYRVTLSNPVRGNSEWKWHSAATWLRWENNEPVEDVPITPEEFGVDAICFSIGDFGGIWQWTVLGTPEWNREACRKGWLRFERH